MPAHRDADAEPLHNSLLATLSLCQTTCRCAGRPVEQLAKDQRTLYLNLMPARARNRRDKVISGVLARTTSTRTRVSHKFSTSTLPMPTSGCVAGITRALPPQITLRAFARPHAHLRSRRDADSARAQSTLAQPSHCPTLSPCSLTPDARGEWRAMRVARSPAQSERGVTSARVRVARRVARGGAIWGPFGLRTWPLALGRYGE